MIYSRFSSNQNAEITQLRFDIFNFMLLTRVSIGYIYNVSCLLHLFMFDTICKPHQCPHESTCDGSQQNRLNLIVRSGTENRASFTVAGMQPDSSSQSPLAISSTGLVKTSILLNYCIIGCPLKSAECHRRSKRALLPGQILTTHPVVLLFFSFL